MPSTQDAAKQLHANRHDLPADTRARMVALLNATLADLVDLHARYKQAHWNIQGPHFVALHELFDALAGEVPAHIDEVAERITALGGTAAGTLPQAVEASGLGAFPTEAGGHELFIPAVADAVAAAAKHVRGRIGEAGDAGDEGSADLLTGLVRDLDKQLWFVESHAR